jgi:hypothetical protein
VGVRSVPEDSPQDVYAARAPLRPLLPTALALALVLAVALLLNGRPIGAGDTRANERVAVSLLEEADFDLDEHPEVEPPFARTVGEHRVSLYPPLTPVMAVPVFAAARLAFPLDETGSALAGKVAAALFSGLAAGALFVAVSLRGSGWALATAVVFALGTSVASTSQALWQHPAAVLWLGMALICLVLAADDPRWAGRAGLPLGLMVAARHADLPLAAVLALGTGLRFPRRIPHLVLWGLGPALFVLAYNARTFGSPFGHGFSDSAARFSAPWGMGQLGLLASPGKGLLVFTPVAAVAVAGLVRAFRGGERWLAGTLGAAALAHWAFIGRWSEWHGGDSWGPRMLTDALPLLFLFLPEGLAVLPGVGRLLAAVSIAVQALGAFAYDYRWERVHARGEGADRPEVWDVADSPIVYYLKRRVVYLALPDRRDGKAVVREHPVVLFGPTGSRVDFRGEETAAVAGTDRTLGDVHLQRGARVQNGRLHLRGRWSGLFLRVRPEARGRRLELRVSGRGRGPLYVGERSLWSDPRFKTYAVSGAFLVRHPYHYPESGGPDVLITTGLGDGEVDVDWVDLVPPGEPVNPLRLP